MDIKIHLVFPYFLLFNPLKSRFEGNFRVWKVANSNGFRFWIILYILCITKEVKQYKKNKNKKVGG